MNGIVVSIHSCAFILQYLDQKRKKTVEENGNDPGH